MKNLRYLFFLINVISFNFFNAHSQEPDSYVVLTQFLNDVEGNSKAEHLTQLLNKEGINSVVFGSLGLTISVHEKDLQTAQTILETNQIETSIELSFQNSDWPKDIKGLIAHLNEWDKEELDVHERLKAYPNRKAHGETNGWVVEHKRLLKKLDASVIWNSKNLTYELVK